INCLPGASLYPHAQQGTNEVGPGNPAGSAPARFERPGHFAGSVAARARIPELTLRARLALSSIFYPRSSTPLGRTTLGSASRLNKSCAPCYSAMMITVEKSPERCTLLG